MKALVVDDHKLFTESFVLLLRNLLKMSDVDSANSAIEALEALEKSTYDLLFLDLNMPGKNGVELCKEVRAMYPDLKVIIISMLDDKAHIMKLFKMGISGYFLKNVSFQELQLGIDRILNGETYFSKDIGSTIFRTDLQKKHAARHSLSADLTEREKEIVKFVCEGLKSDEIATRLDIHRRTVDTHRSNIYQKLNLNHLSQLINYAIEHGIYNPGP